MYTPNLGLQGSSKGAKGCSTRELQMAASQLAEAFGFKIDDDWLTLLFSCAFNGHAFYHLESRTFPNGAVFWDISIG